MPRVLNKHKEPIPNDAAYVGRPTKWGNPFSHIKGADVVLVDNREDAVLLYEHWIATQPDLISALHELRGKDLACWCAPLPCHADVLLRLANATKEEP